MARKRGADGPQTARRRGQLEPPGDLLDGQQVQLGIEVGELPANENPMGHGAGNPDQEGPMGRDTATDGAIARARGEGRPRESGSGQGEDQGNAQPVCPACTKRAGRYGGEYQMNCLVCCATLVLSTRPNRAAAASMLEVTTRHGRQSRADVLAEVKRLMEVKNESN